MFLNYTSVFIFVQRRCVFLFFLTEFGHLFFTLWLVLLLLFGFGSGIGVVVFLIRLCSCLTLLPSLALLCGGRWRLCWLRSLIQPRRFGSCWLCLSRSVDCLLLRGFLGIVWCFGCRVWFGIEVTGLVRLRIFRCC